MGSIIMAETAKGTAKYPIKLFNIMSRKIKEAAEMGQSRCLFSFENLSNRVEESITRVFTDNEFEVTTKHEVKEIEAENGENIFQYNVTHFIIGWETFMV